MKYYFLKSNPRTSILVLRSPEEGFTIIETLVALVIFTTSILAIIVMTPSGISAINLAKNKMTASYLAQEGIDLVRAYRDNYNIQGLPDPLVNLSLDGLCGDLVSGGCTIDSALQVSNCNVSGSSDCPFFTHDANTGGFIYDLGSTAPGMFRRTIFVSSAGGDDFRVSSRVDWNQGSDLRSVEYHTNLTDWNH